jgi:hypothetical protein
MFSRRRAPVVPGRRPTLPRAHCKSCGRSPPRSTRCKRKRLRASRFSRVAEPLLLSVTDGGGDQNDGRKEGPAKAAAGAPAGWEHAARAPSPRVGPRVTRAGARGGAVAVLGRPCARERRDPRSFPGRGRRGPEGAALSRIDRGTRSAFALLRVETPGAVDAIAAAMRAAGVRVRLPPRPLTQTPGGTVTPPFGYAWPLASSAGRLTRVPVTAMACEASRHRLVRVRSACRDSRASHGNVTAPQR